MVFYSVPHAGGTPDLSNYFEWQHQQIPKDPTRLSLLGNMESFDRKMEQLSIDFINYTRKDINIYAFVEGLPIDKKWVRFSCNISPIQLGSIVEHFLCYRNLCWFNF